MKKKFIRKKNKKQIFAQENISYFESLIENNFNEKYKKKYIKQIFDLQKSFNLNFTREFKLKFCKKCFSYKSYIIRIEKLNKSKNYICKNCGNVKRFLLK